MISDKFSYGCELEWSDVDKRTILPEEWGSWDWEDSTIVNSDGHANEPKAKTYFYGGEINTTPTKTIEEQVVNVKSLHDLLSPKSYFRANLHVHIAVEGLKDDIPLLKKLLQFIKDNDQYIFNEMLFRPEPTREEYPDPAEFKAAMRFHKQQITWAKKTLPDDKVAECMKATTFKEFYEGHFMYSEKHQRYFYHLSPARAGINLRSLNKNGTVEFRCFPGTVDAERVGECLLFAKLFLESALGDQSKSAKDIYESRVWNLPSWQPFIYNLEVRYHETKVKDH